METFGLRLKERRNLHRLTQSQVAEQLNINQVTYQGYEKDKHKPDIDTVVKLAKLFQTTTDYLLGMYSKQ
jgi:transcriptional regulator with XRE-family HTH domain